MEEKTLPVGAGSPPYSRAPIFQKKDVWFALGFLLLGWMYLELTLFREVTAWLPTNSTYLVFGTLYAAVVLGYVYVAGIRPPRESWFWLALLAVQCLALITGGPYYSGEVRFLMGLAQWFMLHFTASYWALSACGRLLKDKRTSNWLMFDALNAAFVLPWGNFLRLPAALWWGVRQAISRRKMQRISTAQRLRILSVMGGVLLALVCLCFVLPLLIQADAGFAALAGNLGEWMTSWSRRLSDWLFSGIGFVHVVLSVPVAFYLYGLVYGSVRGRRNCVHDKRVVCETQQSVRLLPRATLGTALGILGLVYVLFIALQTNYLFGAFFGRLAEGFSYAEYARRGFFELCQVAAINIGILLAANLTSRIPMEQNRMLRICNGALSVLTLFLIATAASKMGLYIRVYGLTAKRVLVSVFLLWMAISFVLIVVRQFRPFRLVPWMVYTGAVLFCALCVFPVDKGIDAYNQARVEAGTLPMYTQQEQTLLELPENWEVNELTVCSTAQAVAMGDEQDISAVLDLLRQNGYGAVAESIGDQPSGAEDVLWVDVQCGQDTFRVYAYRRQGACWLEQPYNGIYPLAQEDFEWLWSLVENEGRMDK
ncbi:DUF5301 domain-containing protein [uncultured Ruthenibacterium sp.]|uniref:DUF5301 domain-containing protein n=1 Tax=uncultured Ruthenibacterium sp. TaxID=1905347 RepID=UPI00349EA3B9